MRIEKCGMRKKIDESHTLQLYKLKLSFILHDGHCKLQEDEEEDDEEDGDLSKYDLSEWDDFAPAKKR